MPTSAAVMMARRGDDGGDDEGSVAGRMANVVVSSAVGEALAAAVARAREQRPAVQQPQRKPHHRHAHGGEDGTNVQSSLAKDAASVVNLPIHLIVTDKNQKVTWVNESFQEFTGFSEEEVLGRKCTFLQGEDTSDEDLDEVREAVKSKRETSVVLLNYTKRRAPFWNVLHIRPVFHRGTSDVKGYVGEIFSLPVSDEEVRGGRPKLCVDDVLALLRVASSVPRSLRDAPPADALAPSPSSTPSPTASPARPSPMAAAAASASATATATTTSAARVLHDDDETSSSSESTSMPPTPSASAPPVLTLQRHVNYATRLGSSSSSSSFVPVSSASTATTPLDGTTTTPERRYNFVAETLLPTSKGRFRVRAYRDPVSGAEPLALIVGNVENSAGVLCRVHDQCQTSEVFGSLKCDCKEQLDEALRRIQEEGGMVLYLPQEGRGIGLANKVAAYAAQEMGLDTVDANRSLGLPDDAREYDSVRDILADLKIESLRLLTNNPRKVTELTNLGIRIQERVPIITPPNSEFSAFYVKTKAERMAHMFS